MGAEKSVRPDAPALCVTGLTKLHRRRGQPDVVAVEDVSFSVGIGECVGLVGESGCGKTTIARMVTGLIEPTSGCVELANGTGPRSVQMVFQNPTASFDPRRTLGHGVCESLLNMGIPKTEAISQAERLFESCGLSHDLMRAFPHEVSGGQCQRAAIARAIAPEPSLIVLDEATSALDVTVQAHIIELLRRLSEERGIAYLFICHDLALVQGFCDRVLVMRTGRIVEEGPVERVLMHPSHPYTQELLDATHHMG